MRSTSPQSILIAGLPRSATSFIGKILSAEHDIAYLEEPLMHVTAFEDHYPYWASRNSAGDTYGDVFGRVLRFDFLFRYGWKGRSRRRRALSALIGAGARQYWRAWARKAMVPASRLLIREPHGSFLALGAAEEEGFRVLVPVRHPAGFVASMHSLDWVEMQDQPVSLLRQRGLIRDHLPWLPELVHGRPPLSSVGKTALLWRCTYEALLSFRRQLGSPESFLFVRHEEFAEDPVSTFGRIFEWAGFDYRDDIQQRVLDLTSERNPVQRTTKQRHQYGLKRNSRRVVSWWKDAVSPEQQSEIRRLAGPTWREFYDEGSWEG